MSHGWTEVLCAFIAAPAGRWLAATFQLGATWLAAVSALRETSVLWVALFSTFLLKEGFGKRRVGSTALVLIGLLVMRLS